MCREMSLSFVLELLSRCWSCCPHARMKLGSAGQQPGRAAGAGGVARPFLQCFVQSQKVVLGSLKQQKLDRRREVCRFCMNTFLPCFWGIWDLPPSLTLPSGSAGWAHSPRAPSPSSRQNKAPCAVCFPLGIAWLLICIGLGGEAVFRVCPRPSDTAVETKAPHCARAPQESSWVQPPH